LTAAVVADPAVKVANTETTLSTVTLTRPVTAGMVAGPAVKVANTETTPPTVSLTRPAMGAVVAGPAVILTADAPDGVVGVQFQVNGLDLGPEVTTPPYRLSWYTLSTPNGQHTITAVARDAAGHLTISPSVAVTLGNVRRLE
jgi:hypothetical protein